MNHGFVSEDKCCSHVLSWHLGDELSVWSVGRTFDAQCYSGASSSLGVTDTWSPGSEPSGSSRGTIPLPISVCWGSLPPFAPLRCVGFKEGGFPMLHASWSGQRSSGASNSPSFVWVIRGQPQETDSGFHSVLLMIFSSRRLPSWCGLNVLLGECVIWKVATQTTAW